MEQQKFRFNLKNKTLAIIDWANVYGWFSDPTAKNYLGWKIDYKKLFNYLISYPEIENINFYYGTEPIKPKSMNFQKEIRDIGYNSINKEVKWVPVSLEKSHFKKLIKELFDILDNICATNSAISGKIYELREKVESRLSDREPDFDSNGSVQGEYPPYKPEDEVVYNFTYSLIEEMDAELKKLNLNIENVQKHLSEPVMRRKCDFDVEISRDVFNNLKDFQTLMLFSGDGDYAALVEDIILTKDKNAIVIFAKGHIGKEYGQLQEKLRKVGLKNKLFLCSVKKLRQFLL